MISFSNKLIASSKELAVEPIAGTAPTSLSDPNPNSKQDSPKKMKPLKNAKIVFHGEFEAERHYYPRVLNANIHPLVSSFFSLGNKRILARYTHLNPQVNSELLKDLLSYEPKYFHWAGSDLFNVTTASGHRQMIVVETNSCPSGQKSMPLLDEGGEDHGGYAKVIEHSAKELISKTDPATGGLAVLYDKNPMEASGYAEVLADCTNEQVWMAEYYENDSNPPVKWIDGLMYVRDTQEGIYNVIKIILTPKNGIQLELAFGMLLKNLGIGFQFTVKPLF